MAKSTYFANLVLDHFFGGGGVTPPANVYISLFVGGAPGVGTEVNATGYTRYQVANNGSVLGTTPSNGHLVSVAPIVFPAAEASYGTVSHVGIHDAATNGNLLVHGALTAPIAIGVGDSLSFAAGQLDFSEA